jgi:hypothetical protein
VRRKANELDNQAELLLFLLLLLSLLPLLLFFLVLLHRPADAERLGDQSGRARAGAVTQE